MSMANTTRCLPPIVILLLLVSGAVKEAQCQDLEIQGNAEIADRVVRIVRNGARQQPQPVRDAGATLKTDPDLEATLDKAERFRAEGQFGIAAKLWQSVLERSGDALFSKDGDIYYSLAQRVENIIASLPPEAGLSAYRIKADANAKEIMAEADDPYDERALQLVIRSYFLSSIGDDAALTLSAVYMDQFDFVGAFRLLEKIIKRYPDPSVSISEVQSRMAICQAMMGEERNARLHLQLARDSSDSNDLMLKRVDESIAGMIQRRDSTDSGTGYVMALANQNRSGTMPSLPARYFSNEMEATWQYHFAPKSTRWADVKRVKPIFGGDVPERAKKTVSQKERLMIDRWRKSKWRPSGQLLFDKDNVYFKTAIDLSVWNRNAKSDSVIWRPLWQNQYEFDDYTKAMVELRRRLSRGRIAANQFASLPGEVYEVQLFADSIGAQMSIQDGVLYTIEGPRTESVPVNRSVNRNMIRLGVYSRRSRSNHLTAYEARTGKLLWTLPPIPDELDDDADIGIEEPDTNLDMVDIDDGTNESPWIQSGGFMSSPISYGGLVIVPVNHGGAISIYALDPEQNGKTVWKSYLCDESETGANPYSPVNLSIDGSDLFATCGLGVVFILDPTTGLVRFAKRYERTGEVQVNSGRWGRTYPQMKFESWSSDTVLAYGRQMICFSSDAKYIEAHDRNTGDLIWDGEFEPLEAKVDYLLGVHDGILYAAGPETILAFDLEKEGLMIWGGNALFNGRVSFGRGMLTNDAIYMPVENQIVKFALGRKSSKPIRLKTANVNFGTGAPVGNLFSDGKRIWVQGANRVYALGPVANRAKKSKTANAESEKAD